LKLCIADTGIPVVCLDMNREFPFRSGEFDIVVMGEVLEHGFFPQLILKEVRRVLRDGGLAVGSVPNAYRLKNRLRFLFGREFQQDQMHLHFFSIESLRLLLGQYFDSILIVPIASRFFALSPTLFANILAWRCVKNKL
jgi:SAM-dependent methyltransferase